jgi:hypothetical protein
MKKRNPHPYPLVFVVWEDHTSKDDWTDTKEIDNKLDASLIYSVGWLFKENSKSYLVVSSLNPKDDQVGDARRILKGTVTEFRVLIKANT